MEEADAAAPGCHCSADSQKASVFKEEKQKLYLHATLAKQDTRSGRADDKKIYSHIPKEQSPELTSLLKKYKCSGISWKAEMAVWLLKQ